MAQELLDVLRVHFFSEKQRGTGVPEIMEADVWELRPLQERRERTSPQLRRVDGSASVRGEDEPLVFITVSQHLYVP